MKWSKRIRLSTVTGLTLLLCALAPAAAVAEPPYATLSKDGFGHTIHTQAAYYPTTVIANDIYITKTDKGKESRDYSPLKNPQDVFVDGSDDIYIADTDNNRVVHLDADGELRRIIDVPGSKLNKPRGVFVDADGTVYIADTGNKRIVKLAKDGSLLREFKRPQSDYINETFGYEPTNMVVDSRGFLYVISNGSYQGVLQLDPEGNYYGFYGTNKTDVSIMDVFRRTFYTKEQLSRQIRTLPSTIRNIHLDGEGYIYTVSGSDSEQVKKLTIRGENLWRDKSFGGLGSRFMRNRPANREENKGQLTDVTVDRNGKLTVIDKQSNTVAQYGQNGELLFFWGGPVTVGTPQLGISQSPVSVASNSRNELLILDDSQGLIHVLKPTEFGIALQKAAELSQEGKYQESEEHWKEVLRLNAFYSPAYLGLAQAAFYREDYAQARQYYKLAGDGGGYSEAFWQIRLEWFQHNFTLLANLFIAVCLIGFAVGKWRKKLPFLSRKKRADGWSRFSLVRQLKHALTILKHPLDGFSDLRYSGKGSYLSAFILLAAVAGVMLVKEYLTSFTFMPVMNDERSNSFLYTAGLLWLTWVVCNYLIGSIYHGEARFKDVFVGGAYALFPFVLLGLPLALLSNIMTLSESSIYHFMEAFILIWSGLLFFWKIQSLQNYGVGETVLNMSLTAVAMAILWVLLMIIFGLSTELQDFVYTVYQEVSM
ncbi:YIP1 family protein [Paenibacillus sp. MBLB4367]|uniref:YIP1 family protein n=1 Tax=Paenibacillus sp. MBLB4367 TaxID=3384767 RepID=UPI0039082645